MHKKQMHKLCRLKAEGSNAPPAIYTTAGRADSVRLFERLINEGDIVPLLHTWCQKGGSRFYYVTRIFLI